MALHIRRFDFDGLQDFTAPARAIIAPANQNTLPMEAEEIETPPPPSFSQEELEAAKAAAFAEGLAAGAAQEAARADAASRATQEATLQAVQIFCATIANIQANLQAFKVHQTEELAELVKHLVQKIAGDAIAAIPTAPIQAMITECLGVLQSAPKIILQVHPSCFTPIEELLRQMASHYHLENAIVLKENAALQQGEARMEWGTGSAERNHAQLWQQVDSIITAIDFTALAQHDQPTSQQQPQGEASHE
jgi:flagellar assembly protein FliH